MSSNSLTISQENYTSLETKSLTILPKSCRETFPEYLKQRNQNFLQKNPQFTGTLTHFLFPEKPWVSSSYDVLCTKYQLFLLLFLVESLPPEASDNLISLVKEDRTAGMSAILYFLYNKSCFDEKEPYCITGNILDNFRDIVSKFKTQYDYFGLTVGNNHPAGSLLNTLKVSVITACLKKYKLSTENLNYYLLAMMYIQYNQDVQTIQAILNVCVPLLASEENANLFKISEKNTSIKL
jgi:hypothetical protein